MQPGPNSVKQFSDFDQAQTLKKAYTDVSGTLGVDGWVVGLVGRKIVKTNTSPTVETFSFYESTQLMFTIVITYTDATKADLAQVERTA